MKLFHRVAQGERLGYGINISKPSDPGFKLIICWKWLTGTVYHVGVRYRRGVAWRRVLARQTSEQREELERWIEGGTY